MSHQSETLELDHTSTLLDVVFGVIIAFPLAQLPRDILLLSEGLDLPQHGTTVFLATSALLFSTFYWIETKHFLAEQARFDAAVRRTSPETDGVPLSLGVFLVGSLVMMSIASASLTFASYESYRAFLVANALFWSADLTGTFKLRRVYSPFAESARNHQAAHAWFVGHFSSPYFLWYGAGNLILFVLLLVLDWSTADRWVRFAVSLLLVGLTLVRHLLARAVWYRRYREAWMRLEGRQAKPRT